LVNCAAVRKESPSTAKDGCGDEHVTTNFLGPFQLTEGLLNLLGKAASGGRVVYVTCGSHGQVRRDPWGKLLPKSSELNTGGMTTYSASKLANIYHAKSVASRRFEHCFRKCGSGTGASGKPISVCCVDPGLTATTLGAEHPPFLGHSNFSQAIRSLWLKHPREASSGVVQCCVVDALEPDASLYYEGRVWRHAYGRAVYSKEASAICRWAATKTIDKFGGK
jgi:NAD(P)-dependent dehydrogenase (short-subunit alcohol dehydrogenase family)